MIYIFLWIMIMGQGDGLVSEDNCQQTYQPESDPQERTPSSCLLTFTQMQWPGYSCTHWKISQSLLGYNVVCQLSPFYHISVWPYAHTRPHTHSCAHTYGHTHKKLCVIQFKPKHWYNNKLSQKQWNLRQIAFYEKYLYFQAQNLWLK